MQSGLKGVGCGLLMPPRRQRTPTVECGVVVVSHVHPIIHVSAAVLRPMLMNRVNGLCQLSVLVTRVNAGVNCLCQ